MAPGLGVPAARAADEAEGLCLSTLSPSPPPRGPGSGSPLADAQSQVHDASSAEEAHALHRSVDGGSGSQVPHGPPGHFWQWKIFSF